MRRAGLAALATCAAAACARPVPADPSSAALYRDLTRIVTVAEATGWTIDRIEVDDVLPAALDSVCRTHAPVRAALRAWLDDELVRQGGPVEDAWRARGKRLGKVGDLLTLTRVRLVLAAADVTADADCPFWMEPTEPFRGRQISDGRWQLSFGGGGKAIAIDQGGERDLSFGGAGRLLVGRVLGPRAGLYAGLELGASASFPKDDAGGRAGLVFGFDVVTPVVYRHTLTNAYFEVEAGWLGHVSEEEPDVIDHGVHLGVAFGGRATRTRFLFPGAVLGLSVERTFPSDDALDPLASPAEPLTMVKLGFRAAFDLDL